MGAEAELRPNDAELAMAYEAVNRLALSALTLFTLLLAACPRQELAALVPCTVSAASIDAAQSGVDKVDVLFVVDNSSSMAQEQVKLSKQLPHLVQVLTSGDLDGIPNANGQLDFNPVASLHLGVVSSDLGANGQVGISGCGSTSFQATDQNTLNAGSTSENKPHGDEGRLLSSTAVAVSGVSVEDQQKIAPRPECTNVNVSKFIEFHAGVSDPTEIARQFGCIAELGVNGCGYEQQLESMWRALAPNTEAVFSGGSSGQGNPAGPNAGFLREDAVLVVILVSDEEDCSSPDASASALYVVPTATSNANVLCARNPQALHQVDRYIAGLRSLKAQAYQDRIIFAGIVGVPTAEQTNGKSFDEILGMAAMQVAEEGNPPIVRASCVAGDGRADPARRMVQVAKGFDKNGVITSICEDDYGPALNTVIARIADKLTGACLPRQLKVNSEGLVECRVVEIKAANDQKPCAETPGRLPKVLESRTIGGTSRVVCEVNQLAVTNRTIPMGQGWYYDNFTKDATERCTVFKQRVAFAPSSPLSTGALARVECQQSVLNIDTKARGAAAANVPCADDGGDGPHGDALCQSLSIQPDQLLLCAQGTCQLSCTVQSDCRPGFACTADALGRGYCTNPTCPISEE